MSIQEINQLSNAEKILLVERIWDSIKKDDITLTDSHKQELDRRIAKHEGGTNAYRSWEEVKRKLDNR